MGEGGERNWERGTGWEKFDRFVDCKERKLPRNEGVWGGGGGNSVQRDTDGGQ